MIRFGKTAQTAVSAMSLLAEVYDGGKTKLSSHDIAARRELPQPVVAKVLTIVSSLGLVDGTRGPRFNQSSLVIEAAAAGRGVALAKRALAQADLDSGRLVAPLVDSTAVDFAYFVVHPKAKGRLPQVKAFVSWIAAQAAAHTASQAAFRMMAHASADAASRAASQAASQAAAQAASRSSQNAAMRAQ